MFMVQIPFELLSSTMTRGANGALHGANFSQVPPPAMWGAKTGHFSNVLIEGSTEFTNLMGDFNGFHNFNNVLSV